jgi:hypothetical protein
MAQRETEPVDRTHVWLFRSDIEWLKDRYSDSIGVAKAVRMMVRGFRQKVEAKAGIEIDRAPVRDDLTLEELDVG